jgi:hypothetical protein
MATSADHADSRVPVPRRLEERSRERAWRSGAGSMKLRMPTRTVVMPLHVMSEACVGHEESGGKSRGQSDEYADLSIANVRLVAIFARWSASRVCRDSLRLLFVRSS